MSGSFNAINMANAPGPGSIATSGTSGGSGGDKPPYNGSGGPSDKTSATNEADTALAYLLALAANTRVLLDTDTLGKIKTCLRRLEDAGRLSEIPPQLRSPDVTTLLKTSNHHFNQPVVYRDSNKRFNMTPKGVVNYLPAAMAQASSSRKVHTGDAQCARCKKGTGPWEKCVTLDNINGREYMRGSCGNCGYGNHFENCSMSSAYSEAPKKKSSLSGSAPLPPPRRAGSSVSSEARNPTSYIRVPVYGDLSTAAGAAELANQLHQTGVNIANRTQQGFAFDQGSLSQYDYSTGSERGQETPSKYQDRMRGSSSQRGCDRGGGQGGSPSSKDYEGKGKKPAKK